jgi:hypothetical protein
LVRLIDGECKMPTYARNTDVSADKSRAEIERTLSRYGATAFMYGWATGRAVLGFEIERRRYRIDIPLPDKSEFSSTPTGRKRSNHDTIYAAWEQGTKQRWRAAALFIKATLEASESGIVAVEESLRNFLVLPDGRTVGEWIAPQIQQIYETGEMPPMLPGSVDGSYEPRIEIIDEDEE